MIDATTTNEHVINNTLLCEKCGNPIPEGNTVVDVAISTQRMPELVDELEFDPQDETYLCNECGVKLQQWLSADDNPTGC